jgi:transaldolase
MKIFADTANIDEIKEFASWGVIDGCTTNPMICVKSGVKDLEGHMRQILALGTGHVSIEVTSNDLDEMLEQARWFATWDENVVVKLPMNVNGLKACKILTEEGVKTNVTACMSTKQAILAAKAGATYVSIFWARIEDMGYDAATTVRDTREIFDTHGMSSQIIIGSFRSISHVLTAMKTGAHVLTIPSDLLRQMPWNPRTESTINEFLDQWSKFHGGEDPVTNAMRSQAAPPKMRSKDGKLVRD